MSVFRRGRSLARRGLRVQRRIALAQFLFWPGLIGTGLVAGVVLLKRVRDGAPGMRLCATDAREEKFFTSRSSGNNR